MCVSVCVCVAVAAKVMAKSDPKNAKKLGYASIAFSVFGIVVSVIAILATVLPLYVIDAGYDAIDELH